MTRDLLGGAVLFDLDGTLIDTAQDLGEAMNYALVKAGLKPAPVNEVRFLVGHGARRMLAQGFQLSAGRAATEVELDEGLVNLLGYYESHIADQSRPFDGVIEMIRALRARGAKMAICTNKREYLSRRLIEALGISALFEAIVGADTAAAPKPDPAPVHLCMELLNCDRAVFIGDSDTDIRAAKAAGLACFVAEFGYGPLSLLDSAAHSFSSYTTLESAIVREISG